ncbi:hypothetical protein JQ596_07820 [Bradyrhizobium manausense]|uniref:hypothetical protein n=1 Tax=Bradyrhizobium TaxID=374 RepID=UPI001BAC17CF|nr:MULTISPECIES: hypothetical protein [Bradyrhizobium]MBR0825440.1 hypothetical protein [Bradyrhizobium manausense]UVO30079.1 hypothetical protein KUF59_04745 [Bradyrhizobium arachidis]
MPNSQARTWLIKCTLMAVAVLLVCRLATVWVGTRLQQPAATTRDGNFITLNRYVQEPTPDIVLVGSSVAWRLKEENFLLPRVRNLALPGGSAVTGLEIVAKQTHLPKIVLIEANVLSRPADDALIARFAGSARSDTLLRPLRTAVAAYETWNHPPPEPAQVRASLEYLLKQPPSGFDNRVYVERAVKEMNAEDAAPQVSANARLIRQLVADVEQRGARAFLIEVPVAPEIESTRLIRESRAIVREVFPGQAHWLRIDAPQAELRWADGVHLDERSALIVARAIEKALDGR